MNQNFKCLSNLAGKVPIPNNVSWQTLLAQ